MKILSIGNSFSQDAHRYLHDLAESAGFDLEALNLYIGGCSLERHWRNAETEEAAYEYQLNGAPASKMTSLKEALTEQDWEIITLQQVSGKSGLWESHHPYLENLTAYVKNLCPNATLLWHQTWSYEQDSDHPDFDAYHRDQQEMDHAIFQTSEKAARFLGAEILPCGKVIRALREKVPAFDYQKGGLSLHRDGYHLSKDYGRFAAAATWFETLKMGEIEKNAFIPEGCDPALIEAIRKTVKEICRP